MSAALLLGVLPAANLPGPIGYVRDLLPSTYGVEALARSFDAHPDWLAMGGDLAVCAVVGAVSLAVATWAYRRAACR
jgi:ABC-2 type transport system permease protein